jgi:hypothetical protein
MKTVDLIDEVASLPMEERVRVVDTLLRSLNTPESVVDSAWMEVAQRRLDWMKPLNGMSRVSSATTASTPGLAVGFQLLSSPAPTTASISPSFRQRGGTAARRSRAGWRRAG